MIKLVDLDYDQEDWKRKDKTHCQRCDERTKGLDVC